MVKLRDSLEIKELPNTIQKNEDSGGDSDSDVNTNESTDQEKEGELSDTEGMNTISFNNKKEKSKPKRTRKEETELIKKRKLTDIIGYVKPDYSDNREYERKLTRLATRGVVQLFNAISEHVKLHAKKEKNDKLKKRQAIKEDDSSVNSIKRLKKLENKEPKIEDNEIKIDSEGFDCESDNINTSIEIKEETTDWSDED